MAEHHYYGTKQTDWHCEKCGKDIEDGDGFMLILPEDKDECEIYCDDCYPTVQGEQC